MGDMIACENTLNAPGERLIDDSLKNAIDNILTMLSDKERDVIKLRFGLGGGEPRILEDVGQLMSVTRERVRQIQEKALKKIRKFKLSDELKKYLQ